VLLGWWTLEFLVCQRRFFLIVACGGSSLCTLESLGFSVFVFFVLVDGLWVPICCQKLRGYAVVEMALAITVVYSEKLDTWSIRKKM
jgi:hypothetical protein